MKFRQVAVILKSYETESSERCFNSIQSKYDYSIGELWLEKLSSTIAISKDFKLLNFHLYFRNHNSQILPDTWN